jgi:DNA-binding beta-propeller fold protein YncE
MSRLLTKIVAVVALLAGIAFVIAFTGNGAQAQSAPRYRFDPDWPKPLPNKWKMGGVTGLAVDRNDDVWVLNRPNDMRDLELEAEIGDADCCVRPPSMIHIDKNGNVIGSFDPPQGHGMDVDSQGNVYIGSDTVRKYDPRSSKMLQAVQRAEPQPGAGGGGEGAAPAARVPGRGGPGPTGTFQQQGGGGRGRGNADPAQAAALAAWQAKYPPTAPVIIGQVEEIRLDEPANEMYVADSSFGGRVMVFDLKTFAFKRGWGAYGKPLAQISTNPADRAYKPGGPMPKEFVGHLTLNFSNDGLVYAADRAANRIHVTTKQGKYVGKEFVIHPTTRGTTGGVAFSPDKEQRFLFISDLRNNHIWFLNREDGKILGQMGSLGENGGQFFGLHMIAVDSKGVIYTGEVFNGERVQRFLPVN